MTKKVFLCRYDGAYRNIEGLPTEEQVEAVRRFRRSGGVFGVITERDVFEIMAVIGGLRGEYDFIVCSSGACLIAPTAVASGHGIASVGVESAPPVQVYCHTVQPNVIRTLHGIFSGVGITYMNADTPGFRGGFGMGMDFARDYSDADGIGCKIHFWHEDGQFFGSYVSAEALQYVFPISQARVEFRSNMVVQTVADVARAAVGDTVKIHMDDGGFRITSPMADYACGVAEYLRLAGIDDSEVWALGYLPEDVSLMERFRGLAMTGSAAAESVAAQYVVPDAATAVRIIEGDRI